jgi:hypothetical protein
MQAVITFFGFQTSSKNRIKTVVQKGPNKVRAL